MKESRRVSWLGFLRSLVAGVVGVLVFVGVVLIGNAIIAKRLLTVELTGSRTFTCYAWSVTREKQETIPLPRPRPMLSGRDI